MTSKCSLSATPVIASLTPHGRPGSHKATPCSEHWLWEKNEKSKEKEGGGESGDDEAGTEGGKMTTVAAKRAAAKKEKEKEKKARKEGMVSLNIVYFQRKWIRQG